MYVCGLQCMLQLIQWRGKKIYFFRKSWYLNYFSLFSLILEAGERGKLLRILKLLHDKNETKWIYSRDENHIIQKEEEEKKCWVGLFTAMFCKINRESLFSREFLFVCDHRWLLNLIRVVCEHILPNLIFLSGSCGSLSCIRWPRIWSRWLIFGLLSLRNYWIDSIRRVAAGSRWGSEAIISLC